MKSQAVRAARPHLFRAAVATAVSVAGLVMASSYIEGADGLIDQLRSSTSNGNDVFAVIGFVLFILGGILAVRSMATALRKALEVRLGDARGVPVALALSILGYLLVILPGLELLGVNLGGLLLGGAITGVVVGIAAQQTLANFFAGIVLLTVRPFTLGEHIVLRSGPLGGEYEGVVRDMSLFYVALQTELGPVQLPNAGVLAAAIGPGARGPDPETAHEDAEPKDGGPP
ncbi:MAG: mechanosensitive ion channel [Actinobacteria bacterium]|jgi:small conductance mechanosensitive channel|nr:mechanosensitive ion channel [Actinomycetota bacterium]